MCSMILTVEMNPKLKSLTLIQFQSHEGNFKNRVKKV